MAELKEVPVIIKELSDTEAMEIAIIENLQREDLNPIEEAEGLQALIDKCHENIRHGESFDKALLLSGIFSQMYASWIAIGSRTGEMDQVMERICNAYEEETDARISHMLSLLEPILVIILCFFVGLILISFLLPLLGILSSIG